MFLTPGSYAIDHMELPINTVSTNVDNTLIPEVMRYQSSYSVLINPFS